MNIDVKSGNWLTRKDLSELHITDTMRASYIVDPFDVTEKQQSNGVYIYYLPDLARSAIFRFSLMAYYNNLAKLDLTGLCIPTKRVIELCKKYKYEDRYWLNQVAGFDNDCDVAMQKTINHIYDKLSEIIGNSDKLIRQSCDWFLFGYAYSSVLELIDTISNDERNRAINNDNFDWSRTVTPITFDTKYNVNAFTVALFDKYNQQLNKAMQELINFDYHNYIVDLIDQLQKIKDEAFTNQSGMYHSSNHEYQTIKYLKNIINDNPTYFGDQYRKFVDPDFDINSLMPTKNQKSDDDLLNDTKASLVSTIEDNSDLLDNIDLTSEDKDRSKDINQQLDDLENESVPLCPQEIPNDELDNDLPCLDDSDNIEPNVSNNKNKDPADEDFSSKPFGNLDNFNENSPKVSGL